MEINTFYDPTTYTLTYLVYDRQSGDAVVIDPVLDYDPLASVASTHSVERVAAFIADSGLKLHFVLETHAHADHLSGAQYLKHVTGAPIVIGRRITLVQETFKGVFDLGERFPIDGSQFDRLVEDGERVRAGSLVIDVIATPGHTPACVSYRIGDAVFTGDALFIEDYGTGRCDFPGGDAATLYRSVRERLYTLPDATRVFPGHDYQPNGRALRTSTTIGASKAANVQLSAATAQADFVAFRTTRDKTLAAPKLLWPAVQVNVQGGRLPAYLTIPLRLVDVEPR